jgi:translation initiation factor IF-3
MARGLDLDLVEVAPMANPPVCRIMDYGKFRYEEAQKAKESRKKSTNVSVKEVKFKPKIGRGDFDTKVRKICFSQITGSGSQRCGRYPPHHNKQHGTIRCNKAPGTGGH